MKKITFWVLVSVFPITGIFSQTTIISNFNDDEEAWSVEGGILYYYSQGGNPGGFIEFEDDQDGLGVFKAPDKFLGDLSSYKLGSLEFDLVNTVDNGQDSLYGYGGVTIISTYYTVSRIVVPLHYITEWTTYSIPLTAEEWGLSSTAWDSILSGVTEIRIQMDAQWNYYDRTGLDNFTIKGPENGIGNDWQEGLTSGNVLRQNYPNPFIHNTRIGWYLSSPASVKLTVYDYLGRKQSLLVNEYQQTGYHEAVFNAEDLPDGVYFYQLSVNNRVESKKMLLLSPKSHYFR